MFFFKDNIKKLIFFKLNFVVIFNIIYNNKNYIIIIVIFLKYMWLFIIIKLFAIKYKNNIYKKLRIIIKIYFF